MTCDVCNASVSGNEGTRIPAAEFHALLKQGFGIDETNIEMLTNSGLSRDKALAMLKAQYATSTSDWLLCPKCAAEAKKVTASPLGKQPAKPQEHGSITKMLGIAINDRDAGRITEDHLVSILQAAIDNGDILLEENKPYVASVVFPLLDRGVLRPSAHTKRYEDSMNAALKARVAEPRSDQRHNSNASRSPKHVGNSCVLIVIGVVTFCTQYFIYAPKHATFGYHALSILLPLMGYSVILAVVALIITAIAKRVHEWGLFVFAILFFVAAMVQMLASVARFGASMHVDRTLHQIEQREGMPIDDYLDQQIAESRQIITEIDRRGWRQAIEKDEGKRIEQLPVSELKSYLAYIQKVED